MRPRAADRRKGTRIKKGKTTDYVSRQYIGNIGKTDNGIVSVNAYAVVEEITYPLIFKIFKPRKRLKESDEYKTKTQLAVEILQELKQWGFKIKLVKRLSPTRQEKIVGIS